MTDSQTPEASEKNEILWDTWGVPHIFGLDAVDLFRAFGWAQMHSHGNLLLRLYGQARGRAAEYWGEAYVASDTLVHTLDFPTLAGRWYSQQTPHFRAYLDAFADGVNTFMQEHSDQIADEVRVVLPITAQDVLAHVQRVIFTFITIDGPWRGGIVGTGLSSIAGSNSWAIGPKHAASKQATLLADLHLPWSDLFTLFEAQLTGPGIDAYGAALIGWPVLTVAFNDHLGWTHTMNTHTGWDIYELVSAEQGYLLDGELHAFQTRTQTLKIKQDDQTLCEKQITIRRSLHGPIIAEKESKPLALRVVGVDQAQVPGILEQYWDMARAGNFTEFETVLKRLQIPTYTIIYADRAGHIMHLFGGLVPARSEHHDWSYWSPKLPGDTREAIWIRTHPYDDLPRIVDPPSGWLQNSNSPPWTTTYPAVLNPDDFPSYMAPRFMWLREQRSIRILTQNSPMTFEDMIAGLSSTRMELADRLLEELLTAVRRDGNDNAQRAADVLETWDRQTEAQSRGALLFISWISRMIKDPLGASFFRTPWSANAPLTTPRGLANPKEAVKVLETVVEHLLVTYGRLDIPWGEVFRLHRGSVDLPAHGGPGDPFGIFRAVYFAPLPDGHQGSSIGEAYTALVEFSSPVRAQAILSYGNASQSGSPHIGDQLELFARKEFRPVWRGRTKIEEHLETRTKLDFVHLRRPRDT